jgi:proteasome lid subunit RPN8/RPN11
MAKSEPLDSREKRGATAPKRPRDGNTTAAERSAELGVVEAAPFVAAGRAEASPAPATPFSESALEAPPSVAGEQPPPLAAPPADPSDAEDSRDAYAPPRDRSAHDAIVETSNVVEHTFQPGLAVEPVSSITAPESRHPVPPLPARPPTPQNRPAAKPATAVGNDFFTWDPKTTHVLVHVSRDVLRQIHDHCDSGLQAAQAREVGGVLFGVHGLDAESGRFTVTIEMAAPVDSENASATEFTFPGYAVRNILHQLQQFNQSQHKSYEVVGWYHSHPDHDLFLSGYDQSMFHRNFEEPFCVAMVVQPRRKTATFFPREEVEGHPNYKKPQKVFFLLDPNRPIGYLRGAPNEAAASAVGPAFSIGPAPMVFSGSPTVEVKWWAKLTHWRIMVPAGLVLFLLILILLDQFIWPALHTEPPALNLHGRTVSADTYELKWDVPKEMTRQDFVKATISRVSTAAGSNGGGEIAALDFDGFRRGIRQFTIKAGGSGTALFELELLTKGEAPNRGRFWEDNLNGKPKSTLGKLTYFHRAVFLSEMPSSDELDAVRAGGLTVESGSLMLEWNGGKSCPLTLDPATVTNALNGGEINPDYSLCPGGVGWTAAEPSAVELTVDLNGGKYQYSARWSASSPDRPAADRIRSRATRGRSARATSTGKGQDF